MLLRFYTATWNDEHLADLDAAPLTPCSILSASMTLMYMSNYIFKARGKQVNRKCSPDQCLVSHLLSPSMFFNLFFFFVFPLKPMCPV